MIDAAVEAQLARVLRTHERLAEVDKRDLRSLVESEIFAVLQPTCSILQSGQANSFEGLVSADSLDHLTKIAERRVDDIALFLLAVRDAQTAHNRWPGQMPIPTPLEFHTLAGDSHNGGFRPVLMKRADGRRVVLKFSDPRPYQVMAELLEAMSRSLGVDLLPPTIFPDSKNNWYFVEYLDETDEENHDLASFMFCMGALTAVAFCLGFVDLHLENIVVSRGKPFIVDPECIFYNLSGTEEISERLLSTGLLSHNVHMSSLRGGPSAAVPLHEFSMYLAGDGVVRYRKPVRPHRNKIRLPDGSPADPSDYRNDVFAGYRAAYAWFVDNADQVCQVIEKHVADDLRIRFLVRKTRHYASVIYMLNLPSAGSYADWSNHIMVRFRNSGHFPDSTSIQLINAELQDLRNRDIPYFWLTAGQKGLIHHRTGVVQDLSLTKTPRERAIHDVQALKTLDLDGQIALLEDFLDIDVNTPVAS